MDEEFEIVYLDEPAWEINSGGITNSNKHLAGDDHARRQCYVSRTPDQEISSGVIGVTHWVWPSINLMWIKEE
jgi:hypothetical protein